MICLTWNEISDLRHVLVAARTEIIKFGHSPDHCARIEMAISQYDRLIEGHTEDDDDCLLENNKAKLQKSGY